MKGAHTRETKRGTKTYNGRSVLVEGTGKTAAAHRTIGIPAEVVGILSTYLDAVEQARDDHNAKHPEKPRPSRKLPDAYLLQAPDGGPIRATNFRRVWTAATVEAGVPSLTFHRLRHFAITDMAERGVALEVAARRVGHSSIRVTGDVYRSNSPKLDHEATVAIGELFQNGGRDGGRRLHAAG